MPHDPSATSLLRALKDRHRLAIKTLAAILLIAGSIAFFTRQYSASAAVALNPAAATDPNGQARSAVEIAWSTLTDKQIEAIITQFGLDTEIARLRAQGQVFTYLRSNISLREVDSPGSAPPQVTVSYTAEDEQTAIDVANAIARTLAQAKTPSQTPGISDALARSRAALRVLAQSQKTSATRADVERHLRADTALHAELRETMQRLAELRQEGSEAFAPTTKVHALPTPAPKQQDPQRLLLEQQIRQAQGHLNALLQRYTDQYPDVQDARDTLADLQAKLRRLPPEKPRPRVQVKEAAPIPVAGVAMRIAQEQDQLEATERQLEQKIRDNQDQAEVLRNRLSDAKTIAQDYAWEQRRYKSLLQAQKLSGATQGADAGAGQLFMIVMTATTGDALGYFVKPAFWIAALLAALLAASAAVFLAEQFSPLDEETPSRSLHIS
jgi:hypothetical protein